MSRMIDSIYSCPVSLFAVLITLLLTPQSLPAQSGAFGGVFDAGALVAVGNSDAARPGQAVAILNNPAQVVIGGKWSAAAGYHRLYELEYLQRSWGAAKFRGDRWGVGLSVSRFGKEEFYTETETAMAIGVRPCDRFAFGVEVKNLRLAYTPDAPNYVDWSAGIGVVGRPLSAVTVTGTVGGIGLGNFLPGYDLPREYRLSAAADLAGDIRLCGSWTQQEDDRDILALGQRIGLSDSFAFTSAVYFEPARYALGGEFILSGQTIYYTYLSHSELGGSHYLEFEVNR